MQGKNPPLFILPVSDSTMDRIKERIDSLKISNEKKQTYKKLLLQVKTKQYPWQQDYMQPYTNEKGQIVLREVENYKRNGDNFVEIINALNECGLFAGPNLKNQQADRGYLGGNIDTLPGGICLLGDYGLAVST